MFIQTGLLTARLMRRAGTARTPGQQSPTATLRRHTWISTFRKSALITGATAVSPGRIANLLADEGVDLAIRARNQAEVDTAVG